MLMDSLALEPFVSTDEFEDLLKECSYPLDRSVVAGAYAGYRLERSLHPDAIHDYDAHKSTLRRWITIYGVRLLPK